MKIIRMKTNRIVNPLGFYMEQPSLSYVVTDTGAKRQEYARIRIALDEQLQLTIFDTGMQKDIDSLSYVPQITLKPRTRYYWQVEVWGDNKEHAISEVAWFETSKMNEKWQAQWIKPAMENHWHPVLSHSFQLNSELASARAYVCGLGLYEMEINGQKAGEEYLAPGFNAYHKWLQYQTYDITDLLRKGSNRIDVLLGNGLYKGRFGFEGDSNTEIYGNEFALLCEIKLTYTDGTTETIGTDTNWSAARSNIIDGNIYDGEVVDSTLSSEEIYSVESIDIGYDRLRARLSLPVVIKQQLKPQAIIHTPAGETVLDMGQNMVGWLRFCTAAPAGTIIKLLHGEVLQDGNFYNENLRTAKAEFIYTADGQERVVQPRFTYYGFRYVKVEGWPGELNIEDFTGCVLYSDMEEIGNITTDNELVNSLFQNALWGQRGNFLDVPTDCPQRDERMGWTGDAQVFSGTACFNMDTQAFFAKYGYDMWREQEDRGGMVPMVVPAANVNGGGSSAWGDAATIIPWNVYLHYGDKGILEQQFNSMKAWVDYIITSDEQSGGHRLWTTGFHFGDWLALDGPDPDSPMGGTDTHFIASAYYKYSSEIVAKAAKVLGESELATYYEKISNEVKRAIEQEFFTPTGRLALNTQTAYAVALYMDLVPDYALDKVLSAFGVRLKLDRNHLRTGFVGTPYLNFALSHYGKNSLAYTLLLNDDYPSWLYAVKLGATTIWERWNSILPDGKISSSGMNSLNHYAYGAIVEWMYRTVAGINPLEEAPGFRRALLSPKPDFRLKHVSAELHSAAGLYKSGWSFDEQGRLTMTFDIPFHCTASVCLPRGDIHTIQINQQTLEAGRFLAKQQGEDLLLELDSGHYVISYMPTTSYIKKLSTYTPIAELLLVKEAKEIFLQVLPEGLASNTALGGASLRELTAYYPIPEQFLDELDSKLEQIVV